MIKINKLPQIGFGFGGITIDSSSQLGSFLLDLYPGACLAYSVRKINSAYTGACLRIRRTSDNVEQDFGFDGDLIDDAAIQIFIGGGDGMVAAWYDQSGNSMDISILSIASQPFYVSSGVNGKPAIHSTTTSHYYGFASLYSVGTAYDMFAYSTLDDLGTFNGRMMYSSSSPDNKGIQVSGPNVLIHAPVGTGFSGQVNTVSNVAGVNRMYNVNRHFDGDINTSLVNYRYDTVDQATRGLSSNPNFEFNLINSWTPTQTWLGQQQEMVIYCDYLSAGTRLGVETNTLNYFSNLPLDIEPGASYAYSMRRMSIYYTGNCIRVRRSSDNAEQDFGFVGNLVDDAAIQTFLGVFVGTISVWYDQSGNNNDVLIPSVLAQPTYVSSGYNGKPAAHSITSAQIFGLAVRKELFKNYTLVAHSALDVVDSGGPTFSLGSTLFGQSGPHNNGFVVINTDILRSIASTASIPIWNNPNDGISHDLLTFKTYNSSRNGTAELKVNYDGNTLTPHSFLADLDASFQYLNSWFAGDGWWLGQHQEFIVYEHTVSDENRTEIDNSINTFF